MDLEFFERDRERRDYRRQRYGRPRRRRPHLFSWVLLAGGVVLLAIALLVIAVSLGAWDALTGAYFAATTAVLPASWHGDWLALPGVVHLVAVFGTIFVVTGLLGEILD